MNIKSWTASFRWWGVMAHVVFGPCVPLTFLQHHTEQTGQSSSQLNDSAWEYKGAHNVRLVLQKLSDAFT